MRLLIWHWGRLGAGPRYAALLAEHLAAQPGMEVALSLPETAEIMRGDQPPPVALPVRLYAGPAGFAWRLATWRLRAPALARRIGSLRPDAALCAMPSMLDLLMAAALARLGVPFLVVVHDAAPHPGERVPLQHRLQRRLLRRAAGLAALGGHVAAALRAADPGRGIAVIPLPPLDYGPAVPRPAHGGPTRLLCFGRLLPYKGLDLLADALALLPADLPPFVLRVVGRGPESPVLARLRAMPGVRVENRWVPEAEVPALLGWADALVLPYREASQSGVAAAALAANRRVLATEVGGLAAQLRDEALASLCAPEPAALAQALAALLATPPDAADPPAEAARAATRTAWNNCARAFAFALRDMIGRVGQFR